jgi:protocatechuate 3,4-dioxygenase beta subunit
METEPMNYGTSRTSRRRLIQATVATGIAALTPAVALADLMTTAAQPRGPFYPQQIPLDRDNDLVRVDGRSGLAKGEITDLGGRVLDRQGRPVDAALVEIWQCDANGRYSHRLDRRSVARDQDFQGYGRFRTGPDGSYRFRTIKPVPYPGRAPHIHFAVQAPGREPLVTQMYVRGAPENRRDWLLNAIEDRTAREHLIVDFRPAEVAGTASLEARFDLILA